MTILETDLTLSEPGRLSPEFLAAIARSKGRKPADNIIEIKPEEILAISAQINPKKEPEKIPEPVITVSGGYQIGERVPNKGIYFGVWEIWNDISRLKTSFNMFAAERDFSDTSFSLPTNAEYNKIFSLVENAWHYKNYWYYKNHRTLETCLLGTIYKGEYKGQWFIPPLEILTGRNHEYHAVPVPNLAALKKVSSDVMLDGTYWSSTKTNSALETHAVVSLSPLKITYAGTDDANHRYKVRLVRAELIP